MCTVFLLRFLQQILEPAERAAHAAPLLGALLLEVQARRMAAALRRAADRRDRQTKQQFLLGQILERYQTAGRAERLSVRIGRARLLAVRELDRAAAVHGIREALHAALACQPRLSANLDPRSRTSRRRLRKGKAR